MKTQSELESIALAIRDSHTLLDRESVPVIVKLLRSIELDAWREARELVDSNSFRHGAPKVNVPLLAGMDRIIRQLQLK